MATSLKDKSPHDELYRHFPLRQRMIDDMVARGLVAQTQKGHIRGCKRFGVSEALARAGYRRRHQTVPAASE